MQGRNHADNGLMSPDPRASAIAAHIESVSARGDHETNRLVSAMLERSWPGGTGDRTEAVALEWVRRWGPRSAGMTAPACSCARGHCSTCN
jgi:hypothetical protein